MKILKSLILCAACLTGGTLSASDHAPAFAKGADVGWLTQMEAEGLKFYSRSGKEMECMELLRDSCGVNSIRLRVWVNPVQKWNSVPDVVEKARRAADLGMAVMIDFHFSDTWADPGHQNMPEAWKGLPMDQLEQRLADHVTETLTELKKTGVEPAWVQIGNETTPGMMLPVGSVENPEQLVRLNNAGYDAVKSVFPEAICIVHLDGGNYQDPYDRMFDIFATYGGRYDMIGMSLYPYWAQQAGFEGGWEKISDDCIKNINHLKWKYGKPIMICEIGMPYDQGTLCKQLIDKMMKTDVEGIFYWEPQAPAGYNGGYTLGCFDGGAPNEALDAFKDPHNRTVTTLCDGWMFTKDKTEDSARWQQVRVPHDWAIYGPFDISNDLQEVAVEQNGETEKTLKTGRTGGLPFIGKGVYRTTFEVADSTGRATTIMLDGAMSNAHVRVNGSEVAYWPYGYNSFYADVTDVVRPGENDLVVELENFEKASRWYPGAGLYRNVHVISTDKIHIPVWGTYVTTPVVNKDKASVHLETEIAGVAKGGKVIVETQIISPQGDIVAYNKSRYVSHSQPMAQNFLIKNPELWTPESPSLYRAKTDIISHGKVVDSYTTRFGIRSLEYIPEQGFFLNGVPTKFKGVCNHHDLGPLGAAVNKSALRHQIDMLKDMGANAIRTSHNMPAPELVELCDELGMMLMVEPFDDWSFRPKSPNGYGAFFNEWAVKDITNMVKHYRNNPSVVMWSIGNEVPSQWGPDGVQELTMLKDLVKSLDATRPVTCGMDQIGAVLDNGFAAALDIPGFNYKPQYYRKAYDLLPQKMILGSETASTVSSRGVYYFPVTFGKEHNQVEHPDNQSSSYDNEACYWSNTPDIDFFMDQEKPWVLGQFVWTGFDYLGEPTPYDTDAWPNHSSVFGIIDLASLPKDRYYLYRSQWNKESPTLHMLPHWTWPGREGETTPVFVYTSYPKAELFINGKSQGTREKNDSTLHNRYRLMWQETKYEPGEIKVVAYDENGNTVAEKITRTAGKPHHIVLTSNRNHLRADGDDLAYITIQVADRDGNIVPTASNLVKYKVEGAGTFEATANGDPKSLRPFHEPMMELFSGASTAIVRSGKQPGQLKFTATSPGLKPATITIESHR